MGDDVEREIVRRVLGLYYVLGVGEGTCRNCGRRIYWVKKGACAGHPERAVPYHEDGLPHFPKRCPANKDEYIKRAAERPLEPAPDPEPEPPDDEVVTDIPF